MNIEGDIRVKHFFVSIIVNDGNATGERVEVEKLTYELKMSAGFITQNEMFVLFEIFCRVVLEMDNTFFTGHVFKHEIFNTWDNLLKV